MATMAKVYQAPTSLQLPWVDDHGEDKLFLNILKAGLVLLLIVSVVVPWISVPELTRKEQETLPPQLARVILEKKEIPKPVPPKPKPKPKKKEPKKEPEKKKPEEKPKPKKKPIEKPKVEPVKLKKAQEKAKSSGLLQFQDDLMAMRDSFDLGEVKSQSNTRSKGEAKRVQRDIIASGVSSGSGGIAVERLSKDTQGQSLSGRETTVVTGPEIGGQDLVAAVEKARDQKGRSDADVRKVMERYKDAIFGIYNRELRKDPSLEGKVTFEIVIESSGKISSVKVLSSELSHKSLERKIMARIRMISFGAKDAAVTTLKYSFNFLPY